MRKNFESIHGTDIVFRKNNESKTFEISGYGISTIQGRLNKQAAIEFEQNNPDWTKSIERF